MKNYTDNFSVGATPGAMSFVSGKIVNDNRAERRSYKLLLLAVVVLLGACTSKPIKKETTPDWQSKQSALAKIDSWKMHARIGLRDNDRSGSASLIWEESPEQRTLRLIGPLGGGLIILKQDGSGVTLKDNKGRVRYSPYADELIYRVTGWKIPVSGLRWWLLGLTEPGSKAVTTIDAEHRLLTVQQAGWKVSLDKYTQFGEHELPASIIFETVAVREDERYIRMKVIVKDWMEE